MDQTTKNNESDIITLTDAQKDSIRQTLVDFARGLLGIPYLYGAEWVNFQIKPDQLDCSELVEGIYNYHKLRMPDGSQNQFNFTQPVSISKPGDLGFFGRGGKPSEIYHVGMVFDEHNMIEARGFQPDSGFETGKVILRNIQAWTAYKNFVGFRAHPRLI